MGPACRTRIVNPHTRVTNHSLPDYAERLRLQHVAFGAEFEEAFRRVLDDLRPAAVADVACGDGSFTRMLSRIFPSAKIVGIDVDENFLRSARQTTESSRIRFEHRNVLTDAVETESFNLVFCADSFQSIEDHGRLLRRMHRMLHPGGHLMVTETDNLHDLILSLEPERELELRSIECSQQSGPRRDGWVFPRHVTSYFRELELSNICFDTVTVNRVAPLDEPVAAWLRRHLEDRLDAAGISASSDLGRRMHPEGDEFIGNDSDLALTFLRYVATGHRPL